MSDTHALTGAPQTPRKTPGRAHYELCGLSVKERVSMHATSRLMDEDPGLSAQIRPRRCAEIWRRPAADWSARLQETIERHLNHPAPTVFFRADDIGAGGRAFQALSLVFQHHRVPLAPAVVPAWLSSARISQLLAEAPPAEALWGWHQHGWRHVNWQRSGKKSEFGGHRDCEQQRQDIRKGRNKLLEVFGDQLAPVFTPPWNRLSPATLKVLNELGFAAVSLADPLDGAQRSNRDLRNLRVQIDLHTRKGLDPEADFRALLRELDQRLSGREPVGIMLHHQRMTFFAFEFLDTLLDLLKNRLGAKLPGLAQILADRPQST